MTLLKKIKILQGLPSSNTNNEEVNAVPISLQNNTAPNFGSKVQLSFSTTYTVGSGALANYSKGYVFAGCTLRSDDNNASISFNGNNSYMLGCDTDYGGDLSGYCIFIPAKTGDSFNIAGYDDDFHGAQRAWFVPTKG